MSLVCTCTIDIRDGRVVDREEHCPVHGVVALDDVKTYLDLYRNLGEQIEAWEAMRERCKDQIKERLGESETGTVDGAPVVRWAHVQSRRISPDLLRKKFSEDELTDCYNVIATRRFVLVNGGGE